MSTIVTRAGKGSPLTNNEVDANFVNLNTDKVEKTAAEITGGTINGTSIGATTPSTGVFTSLTVNDNSTFGSSNTDTSTFTGRIASEFTPSTNNTYDLGRNSHEWRNLYLAGTATIGSTVTISGGTANGVTYLNGSKVLTSGSALTFDGTNLGIGTNSPSAKLDITSASAGFSNIKLVQTGVRTWAIENTGTSGLFKIIEAGVSDRLVIDGSGNVGIGTSSPAYKLDVVGTGSIISATRNDTNRADMIVTNSGGTVSFGINSSTGGWLTNGLPYYGYILGPTSSSYGLQFGVGASNTAALTINPAGNLGLGVTPTSGWRSSDRNMQIGSVMSLTSDTNVTSDVGYNYYYNTSNLPVYLTNAQASRYSQYQGAHRWFTAGSGTAGTTFSFTQAMTLTAAGNLGIGTSSPAQKLDVSGSGTISARVSSTTGNATFILNSASTFYNYLQYSSAGSGGLILYDATNSANRVVLDSAGNLGLGVTPSAWNTIKPIEIARAGSFVGANSSGSTYLGANTRFASGWIYANTGAAGLYTVEDNTHFWRIAGSGTAGDVISFTQAMTLSAAGGLSIGLTADAGAGNILLTGQSGTIFGSSTSGSRSYIELYNASTGDMSIATTYSTANIKFLTGGTTTPTERARILADGSFHLQKSSNETEATAQLLINGGGYAAFHWLDSTAYYIGQNSSIRSLRIYSQSYTAGVNLAAGGTSWGTFSDERLKYDIEPITNGLDKLSSIRCVSYRLKDVDAFDSQKKLGVIAQDLVGVVDEVIDITKRHGDETDYLSVRYTELIPVLIKAMQEQQAIIESLKARLDAANL